MADSHRHVDSFVEKVDRPIEQDETRLHFRILFKISIYQSADMQPPKEQRRGDGKNPARCGAFAGRQQFRFLQIREDTATTRYIPFARLGQPY